MSNQQPLSQGALHKQRRSLLRKKARAGWGVGISGAMFVGGLYYMAVPGGIAIYGYKQSSNRLQDLEQRMVECGIKPRSRDKLTSFLTGTAEKLAISALTLGHSESFLLDGQFGLGGNLDDVTHEFLEHSGSGTINEVFNMPVDAAKDAVGYVDGDPVDIEIMTVVGGTAAAVEYVTNRVGLVGANTRSKIETGESQEEVLRRLGVRKL